MLFFVQPLFAEPNQKLEGRVLTSNDHAVMEVMTAARRKTRVEGFMLGLLPVKRVLIVNEKREVQWFRYLARDI